MSAGDTTLTITGNLTADPELRFTGVSRGFGITEEPFAANPRVAVPCGRV
jgi:single-stranded DNA-binding protein